MNTQQSVEKKTGLPATEGARRATGVAGSPVGESSTTPVREAEVVAKVERRRFTAEYKLRVLREIEKCSLGERGALLRREGLYASNLTNWRKQLERGELTALTARKRGRKIDPDRVLKKKLAKQQDENEKLKRRLKQAEMIIDVQKKVSEMLGIDLDPKRKQGSRK